MITSIQKHFTPVEIKQAGAGTAQRTPVTPAGTQTDFKKLFTPGLTGGTSAVSTSTSSAPGVTVKSATAQPAAATPATSTPVPVPPITDPLNRSQVEAHMNAWWENVTQQSNNQKLQVYQQAMSDWQLNNAHCQDLGLPSPPQPTAPTLDPVGPMPTGWWFS